MAIYEHIVRGYCCRLDLILLSTTKKKFSVYMTQAQKLAKSVKIVQDYMHILIEDVIHNGVNYRFQSFTETYLRMDRVSGEDFINARKAGAFYHLDPELSNHSGFRMIISWKGSKSQWWSRTVILNLRHKDIITNKTYEGSTFIGPTKNAADYINQLMELHSDLTKSDIQLIILIFDRKFSSLVKNGLSVFIQPKAHSYMFYYNGFTGFNDSKKAFAFYRRQMAKKIKFLYKELNRLWDGYYYFGLSDNDFAKLLALRKPRSNNKKKYVFELIKLYKTFECSVLGANVKHIFRIPYPIDIGWTTWKLNYKTSDFEYLYRIDLDGLVPIDVTSRCDNRLFKECEDFAFMKWVDRNFIKNQLKK